MKIRSRTFPKKAKPIPQCGSHWPRRLPFGQKMPFCTKFRSVKRLFWYLQNYEFEPHPTVYVSDFTQKRQNIMFLQSKLKEFSKTQWKLKNFSKTQGQNSPQSCKNSIFRKLHLPTMPKKRLKNPWHIQSKSTVTAAGLNACLFSRDKQCCPW